MKISIDNNSQVSIPQKFKFLKLKPFQVSGLSLRLVADSYLFEKETALSGLVPPIQKDCVLLLGLHLSYEHLKI